jgi:hypothetical protein
VEGSCEHGNEPSGSIKCWEVLSECTIGGFSKGLSSTSEYVKVKPGRSLWVLPSYSTRLYGVPSQRIKLNLARIRQFLIGAIINTECTKKF